MAADTLCNDYLIWQAYLPMKLSLLLLMVCLYGVTYIRGSTSLHWRLANRNVSSVLIEPCAERMHKNCSKLVVHNLTHTDTGFYTCSHQKSKSHEVSTYVFVKGKIIRILTDVFSIDPEIVKNWFSNSNVHLVTNGPRPFPSS